jgi:hypothetical protein
MVQVLTQHLGAWRMLNRKLVVKIAFGWIC